MRTLRVHLVDDTAGAAVAVVVRRPVRLPSGLHWDVLGLYGEVLDGLAAAGRAGGVVATGAPPRATDRVGGV